MLGLFNFGFSKNWNFSKRGKTGTDIWGGSRGVRTPPMSSRGGPDPPNNREKRLKIGGFRGVEGAAEIFSQILGFFGSLDPPNITDDVRPWTGID